jgi:hypothetical protein
MSSPPEGLDYQTVFQIIGTFEGFSIWKGARFFRGGDSDINFDISDKVDKAVIKAKIEAMMDADDENLQKEIDSFFRMLLTKKLLGFATKCWMYICVAFWKFVRGVHRTLVFLLRVTPIITIPLLSLSYMLQWGCDGQTFKWKAIVCWFIAVKSVCYLICWGLASMLHSHVNVKTPGPNDGKSIVPEPKKGSKSTAKRKAKRKR